MINVSNIRAISFDLDDTLWPIGPTIERAEAALHAWLTVHSPMTAAMFSSPNALREIREYMRTELLKTKPELRYDLGAIRRESIRLAMYRSGENPLLANEAYQVFYAARNKVDFFDGCIAVLTALAQRYPLATITNGNADLQRVGLDAYFKVAVSARDAQIAKPDKKIFHMACDALGFAPQEVLHIGDDQLLDCLGALSVGMQTVWMNRGDALWSHSVPEPVSVSSLPELLTLLS